MVEGAKRGGGEKSNRIREGGKREMEKDRREGKTEKEGEGEK